MSDVRSAKAGAPRSLGALLRLLSRRPLARRVDLGRIDDAVPLGLMA